MRDPAESAWRGDDASVLSKRSGAALAHESALGAPAAQAFAGEPVQGLSPREAEVLELIAAGQSNKYIARALELSPHTVKHHVANILDKLALASRCQAAAWPLHSKVEAP